MNKLKIISLTAGLLLATTFTFSCSSDDSSGSGNGICLPEQGIACYEGLTEAQCKMIVTNEYKEGNCPGDWLKCPIGGGIINYFHPDFFSDCPE